MKTRCDLADVKIREDSGVLIGYTFAGDGRGTEHNDCAVISLAIAADIPYDLAHALAKKAGRRDNSYFPGWTHYVKRGPFKWREVFPQRKINGKWYPMVLREFVYAYPEGRYFIIVRPRSWRCHAMSVVDGIVLDSGINTPWCEVCLAWRYLGLRDEVLRRY